MGMRRTAEITTKHLPFKSFDVNSTLIKIVIKLRVEWVRWFVVKCGKVVVMLKGEEGDV